MNFLDTLLQGVADAGIYAILLVLGFILFFIMHKSDVNKLVDTMNKSITEIRHAYKEANDSLNEYKKANDSLNEYIEKYIRENTLSQLSSRY